jgi:predicted dehydrogenase
VFCEKPFALTKADADAAVAATTKAGVTLGLGYNRRFHPEMTALREKIRSGEIGTVLHFEATMTFPNALFLKPEAWRADREETAVRRADADGRARDRRDDRSRR